MYITKKLYSLIYRPARLKLTACNDIVSILLTMNNFKRAHEIINGFAFKVG